VEHLGDTLLLLSRHRIETKDPSHHRHYPSTARGGIRRKYSPCYPQLLGTFCRELLQSLHGMSSSWANRA
jgi:hypothetical protein